MSNLAKEYHHSVSAEITKVRRRTDGKIAPIKFGGYGGQGSGKSFTAAMLALGLSIQLHDHAPVYVFDTEPGWHFFQSIFDTEGVRLIQETGESFDGLRAARANAEKSGACVFVGDSYTHIWQDLMRSYMGKGGYVEFSDWNALKADWRDWTKEFLNSPMHCMALGRLGWNYTPEEDDRRPGKIKMVKSDSKFNAGGGESFGYEPHLLIEMDLGRTNTITGRGGAAVYRADVLKDRLSVINGLQFDFPGMRGYQAGDYRHVWNAFAPHIEAMQQIAVQALIPAGSATGSKHEFPWDRKRADKKNNLEAIQNTLVMLRPGIDQKSKCVKLRTLEWITGELGADDQFHAGARAWGVIEDMPPKRIEDVLLTLYALEEQMKSASLTEIPEDERALHELIKAAKRDVHGSGSDMTLIEVLGKKSVEQINQRNEQQAAAGD